MSAISSTPASSNLYVSSDDAAQEESDVATRDQLTTTDFVSLLIAELQSQDPTEPMSTSEMLTQMVQIETIQSSVAETESLESMIDSMEYITDYLESMSFQNEFQAACSMVGKDVTGLDSSGKTVDGTVNTVTYSNNSAVLILDDGSTLPYTNIVKVSQPEA